MTLYRLGNRNPQVAGDAWVAPGARVIGAVELQARASVWFGAVLRGDNEPITVGAGSNIQENSVLHTDMGFPLTIGENCTVGHGAILHGCTLGDCALIGMGATVLNGAVIGPRSLVGAGALVTEGKEFPEGVLIVGRPAKVVRELTEDEIRGLELSALHYQENAARFARDMEPLDD